MIRAIAAFVVSVLVTAVLRWCLMRNGVMDMPNERSSHSTPTPRGGGLSIVAVFLTAIVLLVREGAIPGGLGWALTGGGLTVAIVGLLDDYFRLSAVFRLLMHFLAAGWALWELNGVGPLHLGWITWNWGWAGQLIALIGLVWIINLYNFMDGIDGLAGLEALSASAMSAPLLAMNGLGGLAAVALVLAGASAGFLVWNWQPAKVFLGDVGSGFLGFAFGVLAISSANQRPGLAWPWLILLAAFITDSTLTLIRRFMRGAPVYQAHCTHAYQHAARMWGSHSKVAVIIGVVNLAWLFPLALGSCVWPAVAPLFTIVAFAPLICAAWRYWAGIHLPAEKTVP